MKFKYMLFILLLLSALILYIMPLNSVHGQSENSHVVNAIGLPFYSRINLTAYGKDGYDYIAESNIYKWYVKAHSS